MKIGIVGPIPAELKSIVEGILENATKNGAQVEFLSKEQSAEILSGIEGSEKGFEIPVATAEPPRYKERAIPREMSAKDEAISSILAPLMGKAIRKSLPYKGGIDLSKYSDRDIMAAVFAMSRVLDGPEAKLFVDALENDGKKIAVDFFIDLGRKYGELEGGFEAGSFPELADAMFEIFLEFKKENAKISFDFELVE